MAREWVIRGVPKALTVDMWWLANATDGPADPPGRRLAWQHERAGGQAAALAVLVAMADLLFYGHSPGLSLALFAGAVLAAVMALSPGSGRLRPTMLLFAAALPVVEYLQALSVAFLAAGLLASLVWVTGGTGAMGRRALRLVEELPLRGLLDGARLGFVLAESGLVRNHRQHLKAWAFPLGGAIILTALLIQANPLLDQTLSRFLSLDFGSGEGLTRLVFWLGAALMIWPLVAPPRADVAPTTIVELRLPGPNATSVGRGLVLFNVILGVQTVLDAAFLWGGASLPAGMTAAEYAHRGAYPLLVTALLAGAFALAARPFAREDRQLRWFLLLWLGQNVLLTVSAMLRLELYVGAFGLTYLRIHAAIWMALVAAGLGLTAWQVLRNLPNRWLLVRTVGLGIGTLYVACFVNFAAIIAAENLSRQGLYDSGYVCALGPTAMAAIAASGRDVRVISDYGDDLGRCPVTGPMIEGWRDWGFRNWRVSRYLTSMTDPER
jgi:hypothetical protein